jgi:phosphoribosylformylglycinamidine synthase
VRSRSVHGVHDVSDGGLACAIGEMAIAGGTGATLDLGAIPTWGDCSQAETLFSESANRVVVSLDPLDADAIVVAATSVGIAAAVVGRAGGSELVFGEAGSVRLSDAERVWRNAIPDAIGH